MGVSVMGVEGIGQGLAKDIPQGEVSFDGYAVGSRALVSL